MCASRQGLPVQVSAVGRRHPRGKTAGGGERAIGSRWSSTPSPRRGARTADPAVLARNPDLRSSPMCVALPPNAHRRRIRWMRYVNAIPSAAAASASPAFPAIKLFTIAEFGGWQKAQATHFNDGGVFDKIYQP